MLGRFVDTVGDPDSYSERLTRAFDGKIKFTVAKKADALYKCTGAASICAKVCRDLSIARWTYDEPGVDDLGFGSGYPSDPACVAWLARNVHGVFGYPNFCRFSWAPAKSRLRDTDNQPDDLKAQFGAVVKVDFDAKDEDDAAANSMKITDWATVSKKKQAGPAKKKRKRAHYFRSLESLTELTEVC